MMRQLRPRSSLRRQILTFVGALIILSLLGSTISIYRISEVNQSLDAINRVSVPLGRLFAQMQADAEVFQRELDRRLGSSHWGDAHWRPRPVPHWIVDVLESEIERTEELVKKDRSWSTPEAKKQWEDWITRLASDYRNLKDQAALLYTALEQKDAKNAGDIYPKWMNGVNDWTRQLHWGADEYDRSLRQSFTLAQSRVVELRTGLEVILAVVVSLSLLLLWLGERALRPLAELTLLAREITRRGLRKEDKALLPEIPLSRTDEVSQLAREFHNMATALLEREKTVETQNTRLHEQNRLLREIGSLNESILRSIKSILVVTDLMGKITQCNPPGARWLGAPADQIIGTHYLLWSKFRSISGSEIWISSLKARRLEPTTMPTEQGSRVYGGHLLPLQNDRNDEGKGAHGMIIVLEDLTDELNLQERLRHAENLAAIGRMSAQVAHEVRNPLHSIGLEAEMASEMAVRLGNPMLKQSLQSILLSVDRLEKITENYLKLSRLSAGKKTRIDLSEVLEQVLATYTSACEAQAVKVNWERSSDAPLWVEGDGDLIEQALGNLFKNALQALAGTSAPRVSFSLGAQAGRVWLRIQDNGPGLAAEMREKLFTPFVTTRADGTGLGLSFVKKVIEDHGGTVVHRDAEVGTGACFEVLLPATHIEKSIMQNETKGGISYAENPLSG